MRATTWRRRLRASSPAWPAACWWCTAGPARVAGDRMRRGLVAVLRGAGENAGCRMVAGTLVVAGGAGPMPGMLMRRGSILLDRAPAALSPSFVESGAPDSVFARLVDRHLWAEGITRRPLFAATPRRFGGDNAVLGLGEVVFPRE